MSKSQIETACQFAERLVKMGHTDFDAIQDISLKSKFASLVIKEQGMTALKDSFLMSDLSAEKFNTLMGQFHDNFNEFKDNRTDFVNDLISGAIFYAMPQCKDLLTLASNGKENVS